MMNSTECSLRWLVALGVVVGAETALLGQCPISFGTQQSFSTSGSVVEGDVGDLDNDGDPDVIIREISPNAVAVMRNTAGTLTRGFGVSVDAGVTAVRLGRLDADAFLDAAWVSDIAAATTVYVAKGNGDGTFQTAVPIVMGNIGGSSLEIADIDGDGDQDLLVARSFGTTFEMLLNAGNGTFPSQQAGNAGSTPSRLVVAPIDANTSLDVVAVNGSSNSFTVSPNVGGLFPSPQAYSIGASLFSRPAVGDFNADGFNDIVVYRSSNQQLVVHPNQGNGFFFGMNFTISPGVAVTGIRLSDFNSDARADLLHVFGSTLRVYPSNGGSFTVMAPSFPLSNTSVNIIGVADMNADARPDVVLGFSGTAIVGVVPNTTPVPLAFTDQPDNIVVPPGGAGAFTAAFTGSAPISLRWSKDGVPLDDIPPYSGATTATLLINPASVLEDGVYSLSVTGTCNSVTSKAAYLAVISCAPPTPCPGDADGNLAVNFSDITSVLANFGAACP